MMEKKNKEREIKKMKKMYYLNNILNQMGTECIFLTNSNYNALSSTPSAAMGIDSPLKICSSINYSFLK